jgi:hypothetical protein
MQRDTTSSLDDPLFHEYELAVVNTTLASRARDNRAAVHHIDRAIDHVVCAEGLALARPSSCGGPDVPRSVLYSLNRLRALRSEG